MTNPAPQPTAWDGRAPAPGWHWIDWGPTSRERARPFYFDGTFWEVRDGRVLLTPAEAVDAEWRYLGPCPIPAEFAHAR